MMQGTPRTFVGPTLFALDGAVCVHVADAVRCHVGGIPGITGCELDASAGVVLVTAASPVDRATVLDVLRTTGCPVRG